MHKVADLNIDKIRIITIGKVASSAFKHSLCNKYKISHGHSLLQLKETLEIISINYVLIYLEEDNKNVNLFKSKKYFSNKNILKSFEEAILSYVS